MIISEKTSQSIQGGEFIIKETLPHSVFIPEIWEEEQQLISQTCIDFMENEVHPLEKEIESMKNPEIIPNLLAKAGELGLLAAPIPEVYEGFGMGTKTSMLIMEKLGDGNSFAVAFAAHTGIGTLPILYYGTENQKQKYIPKLASGAWKACYCLTEPDAGSDANSGKTKAELTSDGKHYKINGQKMWITNGGFADVFIVFARIENDKNLTAFIAEKNYPGISMNDEEKKMGIKGSSTRQIFFNDCLIPVENMLSERGNGFKIAVNVLNIGRIKLGAAVLGGSKRALNLSLKYSNERQQFNQPISSFGAIKFKLAEMACKIFATESAIYRASHDIDQDFQKRIDSGSNYAEAKLKSTEEFAIECAITKVHASEVLDFCVDENVQIHGGMGFSADALAEKAFRDARINRIFEGTNEINRLLSIDMLIRKSLKGELDFITPAKAVAKELISIPDFNSESNVSVLEKESKLIQNLKKVFLMLAGKAAEKLGKNLKEEQEIVMNLADILIEIYCLESALLRTQKLADLRGENACNIQIDLTKVYMHNAINKILVASKEAIYALSDGDELKMLFIGLKRFTKVEAFNLKNARRRIAEALIDANKYNY